MDTFRKCSIVVYVNCKTESGALPEVVKEGLHSEDAGRFIPKTVVVDPEISEVIAVVPYARGDSERRKLYAQAFRKIRQYLKDRKKRKKRKSKKDEDKGE